MADFISTQDLINVKQDIEDIGLSVNTDGIITPRYGSAYDSLPKVIREMIEQKDLKLAELQLAIDTAVAAGVGAAGWYSYLVVHDNGETQKQINDYIGATWYARVGGYGVNDKARLSTGETVISTIPSNTNDPNSDMTGWVKVNSASQIFDESGLNQQEINNNRTISLGSVADFNGVPILLGATYTTKAYYANGVGGWSYFYDGTVPKNKHNGGTIIDPSVVFTNITDFLAPKSTTGFGCYVARNVEQKIPAEIFGAYADPDFELNDVCINAAINAASASVESLAVKEVTIGAGIFYTTGTIINTSNRHIIPPKIIGAGRESTQLIKKTNSILGAGYLADSNVDAVLVSSPRSDNPEGAAAHLISEKVTGITLKHDTLTANSIGWYRHRSAMGYVDDVYSENHHTHFVFNDCWMTNFGQLWAHGGTYGYIFNVATSLRGGWLYATSTQGRAFLFDKVIYSDIKCCADHCGLSGDNGATAYRFVDCKGVSGKFNSENHRGELFSFTGSYGMVISGQDWRAKPIAIGASALRMYFSYASVKFIGYDFLESAASLTDSERQQYEFYEKDSISVVDFDVVSMPQQPYGASNKKPIISILSDNSVFVAKYVDAKYIQNGRHVLHTLSLTTDWKMLCYVGDSSRIKINSANSADQSQPYFCYVNDAVNRTVGIKINSISTNSDSPTEIAKIYADTYTNSSFSSKLYGYVADNGWLYVKAAASGYNLPYAFDIVI